MEILYNILDLIPLDFMKYDFMKNAFLSILIISPLFSLLGTMAVNNKMAFFSDALGHSSLTGIAIGTLLGLNNPIASMLAFGIILSIIITKIKASNTISTDTIISVFSSTSMALGIVILSKNGGFAKYSSYLIGDVLTVSQNEILLIFIVLVISYIIWALIYNKLLLITINSSLAASRGIKIAFIENIFVIMLSVTVMLSIRWVGILTINSLLILPCAAARNISRNSFQYHFISLFFGLISGIFGLILSFYIDTSAGATIVLISSILFIITFFIKK